MFGLHDTQDGLWMGNEDGPLLYEDATVASVAAQIVDRALKQQMGRTRALPFAAHAPRLRDEKPLQVSPVAALSQLEEGRQCES